MATCPVCHTPSAKPLIQRYGWCDACNKYRKLAEYFVEQARRHPLWDPRDPEECLRTLLEDKKFIAKVNNIQRARAREPTTARVVAARPQFRTMLLRRLMVVAGSPPADVHSDTGSTRAPRSPPMARKRRNAVRRARANKAQAKRALAGEFDSESESDYEFELETVKEQVRPMEMLAENQQDESSSALSSPVSSVVCSPFASRSPSPSPVLQSPHRAPLATIDANFRNSINSSPSQQKACPRGMIVPSMSPPHLGVVGEEDFADFPELAEYCDDGNMDTMMLLDSINGEKWWNGSLPKATRSDGIDYLSFCSGNNAGWWEEQVVPMATDD